MFCVQTPIPRHDFVKCLNVGCSLHSIRNMSRPSSLQAGKLLSTFTPMKQISDLVLSWNMWLYPTKTLVSYLMGWCRSAICRCDTINPPIIAYPCQHTIPASDGCDGGLKVFRGKSGVATSPQHPLPYVDNRNCLYAIDVSGNLMIDTVLVGCTYLIIASVFHRIWPEHLNPLDWPWI